MALTLTQAYESLREDAVDQVTVQSVLNGEHDTLLIAQLLEHYYASSETVKTEGRAWYVDQRESVRLIAQRFAIPVSTVAAVVSALSPQTRWSQNIAGAIRTIRAYVSGDVLPSGVTLYTRNAHKAWSILSEEVLPENAFDGAPKTRNFWRNLSGDENAITVDTWMLKAMGCGDCHQNGLKPRYYGKYADLIRRAAALVGETPASFQAIVWIQCRGSGE